MENNFISVAFSPAYPAVEENVDLSYVITAEASVHTISCTVRPENRHSHRWLAIRKFDVRLRQNAGKYTMLHNDRNDTWNRDTNHFIDKAWIEIMKQEAMVCAQ